MNKRDSAIQDWLTKNRPDLLEQLPRWLQNEGIYALLAIAFEAGRQFQHDTNLELNNPNIYLVEALEDEERCDVCGGTVGSPEAIYNPNEGMIPCQMPMHRLFRR